MKVNTQDTSTAFTRHLPQCNADGWLRVDNRMCKTNSLERTIVFGCMLVGQDLQSSLGLYYPETPCYISQQKQSDSCLGKIAGAHSRGMQSSDWHFVYFFCFSCLACVINHLLKRLSPQCCISLLLSAYCSILLCHLQVYSCWHQCTNGWHRADSHHFNATSVLSHRPRFKAYKVQEPHLLYICLRVWLCICM